MWFSHGCLCLPQALFGALAQLLLQLQVDAHNRDLLEQGSGHLLVAAEEGARLFECGCHAAICRRIGVGRMVCIRAMIAASSSMSIPGPSSSLAATPKLFVWMNAE